MDYPPPINPSNAVFEVSSSPYAVLLPENIFRAMQQHKLNVIDIREYACIRRICSLDDLSLWAAINDEAKFNDIPLNPSYMGNVFDKITPEENREFTSSVLPLSRTGEVAQAAREFLSCDIAQHPCFYEFKSIGKTTLVVVRRGFMRHLQKTEHRLAFLRELMKQREQLTSYHEATDSRLFSLFLQLTTSFNG